MTLKKMKMWKLCGDNIICFFKKVEEIRFWEFCQSFNNIIILKAFLKFYFYILTGNYYDIRFGLKEKKLNFEQKKSMIGISEVLYFLLNQWLGWLKRLIF